jgi:hypothetical protein
MVYREKFDSTTIGSRLKRFSILNDSVATLISAITLAYFSWVFEIDSAVPDFFYDADAPRTLGYVTEPNSAISFIRPFLFLVSWIPNSLNEILQSYRAWSLLSFCCILIAALVFLRIFREINIPLRNVGFLITNLSLLCWTVVPDTFILGITFFMLGVLLYGDGSRIHRVTLSGIFASSLNIFLLAPWLTAHILLGRKTLVKSVGRAVPSITIVAFILLSIQYLQRFKPPSESAGSISSEMIKSLRDSSYYEPSGILSSVDAMGWFHSPFIGMRENFVYFFTAPWTQGYSYITGTWAIDSVFLPFAVLFTAVLVTLVSYFGIFFMHRKYRVFVSFAFGLEIWTCILFLTYSSHPFLFAPFLLISRVSGLIYFVYKFESLFIPLILVSSILTISSLQFMP